MTYEEAKADRHAIEAECQRYSARLNSYPRNAMGLTPDHIKATDEWRAAFNGYHRAARKLRLFNTWFTKEFRHELQQERTDRRRGGKYA